MKTDRLNIAFRILLIISALWANAYSVSLAQANLINIKSGAKVYFAPNSTAIINGGLSNEAELKLNGSIKISGDWTNTGTQTMTMGVVEFFGADASEISGTGSTQFFRLLMNKQTRAVELRLNTALTGTPSGFLELQSGTFRVVGNYAFVHTYFPVLLGEITIPVNAGFRLDNPNASVAAQSASIILHGLIQISQGTFNIGISAGNSLKYNATTDPAELVIEGGELNIYSGLYSNTYPATDRLLKFSQSGGLMRIGSGEISIDRPKFEINSVGSIVETSGGEIRLVNHTVNAGVDDFTVLCDSQNVSGGLLKVEASVANQDYAINSKVPIGNLEMADVNNPVVRLRGNKLNVLQDVTIAGSGADRFIQNGVDIELGGDWYHNISSADGINQGTNSIIFSGAAEQNINSTTLNPIFARLMLNKSAAKVNMTKPMHITHSIRLLGSRAILDMEANDLILAPAANIYSDLAGTQSFSTSFGSDKYILNSGSDADPLQGAGLIKELNPASALPIILTYPIGTNSAYSPAEVELLNSGAILGTQPKVRVKVVPQEHPAAEVADKSLKRYWNITTEDVAIQPQGATVKFYYSPLDAIGSEGNYRVLLFAPPWNTAGGYWRVDPGRSDDIVRFDVNMFYSQQTDTIIGDWTAGEPEVARAVYYSRADGNYNDPNTWSKLSFGGAVSNTVPNKRSDEVRIQGNTVTITENTPPAKLISVETGQDGRTNGVLKFTDEYYAVGDTLRVQPGASLYIGSADGLVTAPSITGNVRTIIRDFSNAAYYGYWGGAEQTLGNAVPNLVAGLIINKNTNTKLTLNKNIAISAALTINQGILDMSAFTINGNSAGRTFTMNGGELIVPSAFPINYSAPTFSVGRITFAGDGNITIPSSLSSPGVIQYNDLKIMSTSRSGNVTLAALGEIAIHNSFDISEMNFADATYRFFTDGSTFRFRKSGGVQEIPYKPQSPDNALCYLQYYNLIVDGAGTKRLSASAASAFTILKDLTIDNSAQFEANGLDIEIYGNWLNRSGAFVGGTSQVTFHSDVALATTNITSRSIVDNVFNSVRFTGAGIVNIVDNFRANGSVTIDTLTTLKANANTITVLGDWNNLGGLFSYGTSTVRFDRDDAVQNITKTSGNSNFYNLVLNNPNSVIASSIGWVNNGIKIFNNLNLDRGNLKSHNGTNYRYVEIGGAITRSGGGFVDGELRKSVANNVTSVTYEVGHNVAYTPVTLDFTGTGGTAGILGVISDTITTATTPVRWADAVPSSILPAGSSLSPSQHIARQYRINIPIGSAFVLGNNRRYDATLNFINAAAPDGDLRNSADANQFDIAVYNGTSWILAFAYGTTPVIAERNAQYTKMSQLKDFGAIVIGMPNLLTYYSRQTGNWNNRESWSQQDYGGAPAATYPGEVGSVFNANIADGHKITMQAAVTVNAPGIVLLDSISLEYDDAGITRRTPGGTLMTNGYVLSGSGTFRMLANSTLGIGDAAGITTVGTNTGSIRTTTARDYNYERHQRSSFIYTGGVAQNTGNGLPIVSANDTIANLIIDKTANTLTVNASGNIQIRDSLYIKSGAFSLGNRDLTAYGNMRKASGAIFNPNSRTVFLRGGKEINLISENYNEPIDFYRLYLLKDFASGDVILGANTNINITNALRFEAGNKVIIDATKNYSLANPLYVRFEPTAIVEQSGMISLTASGGWIFGEVRKNIAADDAAAVTFETGTKLYYSPILLDFRAGTGSTAGYLSCRAIAGEHPYMVQSSTPVPYDPPVSPNRNITVYWKVKKPNGSTFERGSREFDTRVDFENPDQQINTDTYACADLSFFRGNGEANKWQGMYFSGTGQNSQVNGNGLCGDTRITPIPTPTRPYAGTAYGAGTGLVFIRVNQILTTMPLGTTDLEASGDLLLADFVAGNRNTIKYYKFYSIRDGNWSDPNTWSTESYSGTVNAAATDNDPLVRPIPTRQYDNVYIGNGKNVKLDVNIGCNNTSGGVNAYTFSGPSVFVENTGTLDFCTSVLRGNQFNALAGSKIIIGSNEGISNANSAATGNVRLLGTDAKFQDSIDVVYASNGVNISGNPFTLVNRNSTTHYLESVTIRKSSDNSIVLQYESGNKFLLPSYGNLRCMASCTLNVGESYYIEINPSDNGNNRRYESWANWNYDGSTWTDLAVVANNNNNDLITLPAFIVPAANNQGSTILRIGVSGDNSNIGATSANTTAATSGEYEDYTIYVRNSNYVATQSTGVGLPTLLNSFTVHSLNPGTANPQLNLGKSIIVMKDLTIKSGRLNQGANNIDIYRDFVHDTLNGFIAHGTNPVRFLGSSEQRIRGNAPATFNNFVISKTGSNKVYIDNNATFNATLSLNSNNIIALNPNNTLTFGANGAMSSAVYSAKRMIQLDGVSNISKITKNFASIGNLNFMFPVGIDTVYNPAEISMTGTPSGTPSIALQLFKAKHPNRLTDNILEKFWRMSSTGISNVTASSFKFHYVYDDVNGDTEKYIPGRYNAGWEIDLGTVEPKGTVSPITIENETQLDGDWTVGEPYVYYTGRIFYTIKSGSWNQKFNWSTNPVLKHNGTASSYFPGQLYSDDTVNVDGHTIRFEDSLHISIDSLRIGGTNSNGIAGRVLFGAANKNKAFEMRALFLDNDNGDINIDGAVGQDTIIIRKSLINNSSAGLRLRADNDNHIGLKFVGSGNMEIGGTGTWTSLADVYMNKEGGLADTLIVNSNTFITATQNAPNYLYHPQSGVVRNNLDMDLILSTDGRTVDMNANTGIDVVKGRTLTKHSLSTNSNTTINIDGGDLIIGNAADEHLLYKTGTTITIDSGLVNIAGGFAKAAPNSIVDFIIKPFGTMKVNTMGNTSSSIAGFDISNAGSSFAMDGGRIVIANASGTTAVQADMRLNAQNGAGISGGTIQAGDSTLTPNNTTIKIAGSLPVYDLHFANNPANNVSTNIVEQIFTIKNDWTIDANHSFNLSGNTVVLGGDLSNRGSFNGVPSAATSNSWMIELNGIADQNLYNLSSRGLELYNLRINKTSGNVLLDAADNSNLIVRNSLEFTADNNAVISTQKSDNRYVELTPMTGEATPQFLRIGLGHIDGWLHRWIDNTSANTVFHVGALDAASYRPATFQTLSSSNTAGLIAAKFNNSNHTEIGGSMIDAITNIEKYWTVKPISTATLPASNAFALGAGQNYNLTLQYLNPTDLRPLANPLSFEQFVYSPALPDAGAWSSLESPEKTNSTVKSVRNTIFGDFVIGEPSGVTFYSYQSGAWDDLNTWSMTDYETNNPPARFPNQNTDIVRVGNGKIVTVPKDLIPPEVRSVIVEKFNGLPGYLQINGQVGNIRGTSFSLGDDCTIGVQHIYGIAPAAEGPRGAIATDVRTFGVSRYIYNSSYGPQVAGNALPNTVKTLVVDNPSATNNDVFLNTYAGVLEFNVNDTLMIRQGRFNTGGRNINILNTLAIDSIVNDGVLESTTSRFNFTGGGTKYIDIGNYSGLRFNDIRLDNSNVSTKYSTYRASRLAQIYVKNNLIFNTPNVFILGDSVNLIIENSAVGAIVNAGPNRFVRTSPLSGLLIRKVAPSLTYTYPIGSTEGGTDYYAPMEFTAAASGTVGSLGVRTSWGKGIDAAHLGLSSSTLAEYMKRYWAIDSVTVRINGQMKFYYNDNDFASGSDETDMTKIGRWQPSKERTPGSWFHPATLNINTTNNTFQTDANFSYEAFTGDWLMGNKDSFRRIFYSRINGDWTTDQSWTYNQSHSGAIAGIGVFPNSINDSVIIGAGHQIRLNVSNPFVSGDRVGIALGTSNTDFGILNLQANILNGDYFTMSENSTLMIGSADGISTLGTNTGGVRTLIVRQFNPLANYVYNGAANQAIGTGLPNSINSLTIANTGDAATNNNNVALDRNLTIANDLIISSGALNMVTYRADKPSSSGTLRIVNGAYVRIGGTNNMRDLLSNYATYTIDDASIFNFYGSNQLISNLPIGYTNGFGIVTLQNSGTKSVTAPLLIRGDLYISNDATLDNGVGVDALSVRKNIFNSATVNNAGVIEIGQ